MTEYKVYSRATGAFMTSYRSPSDAPIDMAAYGFAEYDHQPQSDDAIAQPIEVNDHFAYLIDIGPYFDRFGVAKLPVLACADNVVQAIVRDVSVRKWIDLKRPEVAQALAYITTKVPEVTPEIVQAVLAYPVLPQENAVLRTSGYMG